MIVISRLTWAGVRDYEGGIDRGVYYPSSGQAEAWDGLISINEKPIDVALRSQYVDGVKVSQKRYRGYFSGTIEAYSYPDSLYSSIFSKKPKSFGLSYRTGKAKGYKIHLVYNVLIEPSPYLYQQLDLDAFRWPFTCLPVPITEAARSAHLIVDTAEAHSPAVVNLEDILYGTDESDPRLPMPEELFDIFEGGSVLLIIDNGDGSWTAIGPASMIQMLDATTFQITSPTASYIDADTYTISSF